ncbi:MAG: polysaccharide biosynthesis protein [Opitutales bacterium]
MSFTLRVFFFLLLYAVIAVVSYWGAWMLRFGFNPQLSGLPEHFQTLWWKQGLYLLPLKLLSLYAFGQFHGFIRFFRFPDAVRLAMASGLFSFCCLVVWYFTGIHYVPPALVLAADFLLFTFLTLSLRVGIRLIEEWQQGLLRGRSKAERVAVIGVGEVGSSLVSQLLAQPGQGMRPVAFFDDSKPLHGRRLHGLPVLGAPEEIPSYFESHELDKVVLAMPSASAERIREISILLKLAKIPLETVPTIGQLLRGAPTTDLRELRIEDLLYREPVAVEMEQVRRLVQGKRVWVTGAGGSIGSELAFQLAHLEPAELMLIDASEGALFQVERRLLNEDLAFPLKVVVLDLRDRSRVGEWMQLEKPELIYHAAAHKHVGMMERQPREAFANNTMVTLDLARQAVAVGVESFCLISTDKAVEPSSVMGATKRLAEKAVGAMIDSGKVGTTVFSMVRFGNVLGSSGSVIPIFEQQIAERRPVTVTDKEMTRYFMTIAEAVGLVLQATAFKARAALFTLDMGEPVRIDDVARDLIRLKGLEPDVDIPVIYTGIRPGEKLHETIHYPIEKLEATAHPKIQRVLLTAKEPTAAEAFLQSIESLAEKTGQFDDELFRQALRGLL